MGVDGKDELTVKDKGFLRGVYARSSGTPDADVALPHQKSKNLETLVLNVEKNGDARAIGQQGRQNIQSTKFTAEEKKKERDRMRLLMQTLAQSIEEARRTLDDLSNLIDLKLEQANTAQALKQQELNEITGSLSAIGKGITLIEKGQAPELDEHGGLKDPALEAAVKAWEEKNGKPVDRENSAYLVLVFKHAKSEQEYRQILLKEYLDVYKKEIEFCKQSESSVKRLKEEGQGIENKTPEEQKAWIDKIEITNKTATDKLNKFDAIKDTLDAKMKVGNVDTPTLNGSSSNNPAKIPAPLKIDF